MSTVSLRTVRDVVKGHKWALENHALPTLDAHAKMLRDVLPRLDKQEYRESINWARIEKHEQRLDAFEQRTFWGRLRWLVTGR